MVIEVKRTVEGWDHISTLVQKAFGAAEAWELNGLLFEPERSLGAYDGGTLVGHTCVWSLDMRVPGRTTPMAGVTMVSVLPTHRRRGVASSLLRQQLVELHETGAEPLASLTASEAGIYGRYGYGPATEQLSIDVLRSRATMRPVDGIDQVALRYAEPDQNADQCAALHAAATADRPGSFLFSSVWQRRMVADAAARGGMSQLRCVVAERDGEPTGFTYYRTKLEWSDSGPNGTVHVERVHATDLVSYAALWRHVFDLDLTGTVSAGGLAVDEPVLDLLLDPWHAKPRLRHGLWVRLVDVDRALATRTYATAVDAVLEVRDEVCPWNGGRWRLSADESGATCSATTDPADLVLGVRELGSVFLGRPSLRRLGAAGLVEEQTKGALTAVSRAFTTDPLPSRDTIF